MKATTVFLNQIVLAHQPQKITSEDRAAVWQLVDAQLGRTPASERGRLLTSAAALLDHRGWPEDVAALVVRLITYGVGADDTLLVNAYQDRHLRRSPWGAFIAEHYGLGYPRDIPPEDRS